MHISTLANDFLKAGLPPIVVGVAKMVEGGMKLWMQFSPKFVYMQLFTVHDDCLNKQDIAR